jgi:hypothetical protein
MSNTVSFVYASGVHGLVQIHDIVRSVLYHITRRKDDLFKRTTTRTTTTTVVLLELPEL